MSIFNRTAYEFADSRKDTIEVVRGKGSQVTKHLFKVFIYPRYKKLDPRLDPFHWLDEVANWLEEIGGLTTKPKNRKLKLKDYEQHIFYTWAHTFSEFEIRWDFMVRKCIAMGYPKVPTSKEQINTAWELFNKVRSEICPMLASEKIYISEDYYEKLINIHRDFIGE